MLWRAWLVASLGALTVILPRLVAASPHPLEGLAVPPLEERLAAALAVGCRPQSEAQATRLLGAASTCELILSAPPSSSPDDLTRRLARAHRIPHEAAHLLLEAEATNAWLQGHKAGVGLDERAPDLYVAAARAAPESLAPLAAVLARRPWDTETAISLLGVRADPVPLARRLVASLRALPSDGCCSDLRELAEPLTAFLITKRIFPDAPRACPSDFRSDAQVAMDLEVLDRLEAGRAPDAALAPWAALLLCDAIQRSLPELAVRALAGSPPGVRTRSIALASSWLAASPRERSPDQEFDPRLDLALTLLEAGAREDARAVAKAARPPTRRAPPNTTPDDESVGNISLQSDHNVRVALLGWHLEGVPADPFDVALWLRTRAYGGADDGQATGYDLSVLATPILRQRFPQAIRPTLEGFTMRTWHYAREPAVRKLLPAATVRVDGMLESADARRAEALASLPPTQTAAAASGPPPRETSSDDNERLYLRIEDPVRQRTYEETRGEHRGTARYTEGGRPLWSSFSFKGGIGDSAVERVEWKPPR